MAQLKRSRGGISNQLQIAAQGRYRLKCCAAESSGKFSIASFVGGTRDPGSWLSGRAGMEVSSWRAVTWSTSRRWKNALLKGSMRSEQRPKLFRLAAKNASAWSDGQDRLKRGHISTSS